MFVSPSRKLQFHPFSALKKLWIQVALHVKAPACSRKNNWKAFYLIVQSYSQAKWNEIFCVELLFPPLCLAWIKMESDGFGVWFSAIFLTSHFLEHWTGSPEIWLQLPNLSTFRSLFGIVQFTISYYCMKLSVGVGERCLFRLLRASLCSLQWSTKYACIQMHAWADLSFLLQGYWATKFLTLISTFLEWQACLWTLTNLGWHIRAPALFCTEILPLEDINTHQLQNGAEAYTSPQVRFHVLNIYATPKNRMIASLYFTSLPAQRHQAL